MKEYGMSNNRSIPFTVSKDENFFDRLGEYVGDVFYDILPDKGYELRDEQIYMAFQLEQAFKKKKTIFAEAGVGTGKTFVYLIYAICYARYVGRPAIISCADETLIEQLVKKGGDIEKLEKALGMDIDIRLAKSREQYVCARKLNALMDHSDDEDIIKVYESVPDFVFDPSIQMKSMERYGDRKEYPWVSDEKWETIAWDPLEQCSTCSYRHRSAQTLNREYYRHASDIIVCSHDFFMEHVWTRDSRKREGQMPLLPEMSSVIFDEGHLLEFAAQKGLTYRYNLDTITNILTGYLGQNVREESLQLVEDILLNNDYLFEMLSDIAHVVEGSNRQEITLTREVLQLIDKLNELVNQLLEELVFDSELFLMEDYYIKIIEEYLEFYSHGLRLLLKEDEGIYWLEEGKGSTSLVIMPRLVEDVLKTEVFKKQIPFVFSSATLSQQGDFSYIAKSLGIEKFESFSVDSPFDYQNQMKVYGHINNNEKWKKIYEALQENNGRTLILFATKEEMQAFRLYLEEEHVPLPILYEGDQEISGMVRRFQVDEQTTLCSYHLWEGLDIPGNALTQVIISSLPFPPNDPVFKAKRKFVSDPERDVDLPYMLLRLRQGIGRLIRTNDDHGSVHIWMNSEEKAKYFQEIKNILPVDIVF